MGYHHVQAQAQLTGIAAEEHYVQTHAAAVDRTINSREFRLGTQSYVETGHVPQDKFWTGLAHLDAKNPALFAQKDAMYAGFFAAPARLGELPSGNVLFDVMRERDQANHATFAAHHSFYVNLVDHDLALRAESLATPALTTTPASLGLATNPSSSFLLSGGTTTSADPAQAGMLQPFATVPEPASALMVALGCVAAYAIRRFRGRASA